ncbi:MAG: hypothetical protein MJ183_01760 [Treponemataceae bacterium]|nr:hypothetical protein [Treponemataceae bacterium]
MPGLNQLKKFTEEITLIGNEPARRQQKHEIMPKVSLPANASIADDSDDFVFGLPQNNGGSTASSSGGGSKAASVSAPTEDVDIDALLSGIAAESASSGDSSSGDDFDLDAILAEVRGETEPKPAPQQAAQAAPSAKPAAGVPAASASQAPSAPVPDNTAFDIPGLDDIFNDSLDSFSPDALAAFNDQPADDIPELEEIEELEEAEELVPEADTADQDLPGFGEVPDFDFGSDQGSFDAENSSDGSDVNALLGGLDSLFDDVPTAEDLTDTSDVDSLLNDDFSPETGSDTASDTDFDFSGITDFAVPDEPAEVTSDVSDLSGDFDLPADDTIGTIPDIADVADISDIADSSDISDVPDMTDIGDFSDIPDAEELEDISDEAEPSQPAKKFSFHVDPDLKEGDFELPPMDMFPEAEADSGAENGTDDFALPDGDFSGGELDMTPTGFEDSTDFSAEVPDFDTSSFSADSADTEQDTGLSDLDSSGFDMNADFAGSTGELDLTGDFGAETADGSSDFDLPDITDSSSDDSFDMPDSFGNTESSPDFSAGTDEFDTAGLDSFDFNLPEGAGDGDGFESIDNSSMASGDDFSAGATDDNDFSIPGYSDFELDEPFVPQEQASPKTTASSSGGKGKGKKTEPLKTELTEEEYKQFRDNLNYYPLNLRIAIQELIVGNEFSDEVTLEVINKVLKRVPARQLATHAEKILDKSIPVPANYEKRTAQEYESYKQSFEYHLKNRIIPFTLAGLASLLVLGIFIFLIARFVVRPVKAELLYKEGYTLIENGLYQQSEYRFNEAITYKAKKSWYYKYARAYQEKRQYERSANMFERLLKRYNYEKQAGIEYAQMELNDLANYERAETVTKRYVLDYHINDKDAILLLGDIYLEWATATEDPELYDKARTQYATLMNIYGQSDLYLSRMMRYFIRTDNIREVLPLKNYFYPKMTAKKNPLEAQDLVDLSGYLMEKLYGELPAKDEFLRNSIEDVRDLLEKAVKAAPEMPESVYNYGRYFVETGNENAAKNILTRALEYFDNATVMTKPRILRHIDTYRILGELHTADQEYVQAEEMYTEGLELFAREQQYSGLATNEKIGKLYSDQGDLDYFISNDLDSAYSNYSNALKNLYDTPSIHYRLGYIEYAKGNYSDAMNSFIRTLQDRPSEENTLYALANTLAIRNSNEASQSYYELLLETLDLQRVQAGVLYPQVDDEHGDLVDLYMKAANNLAVVQYRSALQNGNSSLNAKAMVNLQESIRAWDALTRNQNTMIRLGGTNLAEQNLRYITVPNSRYSPEIYTQLPRILSDEQMLTQSSIK